MDDGERRPSFVRLHVVPGALALAVAASVYFIPGLTAIFYPFDRPASFAQSDTSVYYRDLQSYGAEARVRAAMRFGRGLVVLGSSELDRSNLRAIPYNFFGTAINFPCIGVGFNGNQSFSIATQLIALRDDLPQAKLVIVISPAWFFDRFAIRGTELSSFLAYLPERFLYRIWSDPGVPPALRDRVGDYVEAHFDGIASPSPILRLIEASRKAQHDRRDRLAGAPFRALYAGEAALRRRLVDHLYRHDLASAPLGASPSDSSRTLPEPGSTVGAEPAWESLMSDAARRFSVASDNNPYGVENAFYDAKSKIGQVVRHVALVPRERNRELDQFHFLLSVVAHYRLRPLFVIQALNPLTYPNLSDLDPVVDSVEKALQTSGQQYLNLYSSDSAAYVKGTLADVMHFGDYGWYLVDRAIYRYFFRPAIGS